MAGFKKFEDIEAWQKARNLNNYIYKVIAKEPFNKDFSLRDQIKRASYSIMSNIAEGFERGGSKEFKQFLSIAKGSSGEVRNLIHIALDQSYITKTEFDEMYSIADEVSSMIYGLIKYLNRTDFKGTKYKDSLKVTGNSKP